MNEERLEKLERFLEKVRPLANGNHGMGCIALQIRTPGCTSCDLLNALDELDGKEREHSDLKGYEHLWKL